MPIKFVGILCRAMTMLALLLGLGCSSGSASAAKKGAVTADVVSTPGDIATAGAPTFVNDPQDKGPAVSFQGTWQDAKQLLHVTVWVHDFPHLVGLAGHMRYDPDALKLVTVTPTGVPVGDTPDPLYESHAIAKDSPAGRILAGGARFMTKPSMYTPLADIAVSSELWLTLDFQVLKPGSHKLFFDPDTTMARSADGKLVVASWGSATIAWGGGK